MVENLRIVGFLTALTILVLLAGCAVNPVTGQQQLMLVSEQDEAQMGQQTDQSVVEQYGVYDNRELQGYLQGMGLSIARLSHRPGLNWQFKVMDSPVVNAFAAPGGYIYVTRGLLAATNNEAELAGVIGHEIGHVTARHSAQQYSKMMLANLGISVGQSVMGGYGDALGKALEAGTGLLFLKFSRDDEREADTLGVEYATKAGYDATRIADFFTTLQRQSALSGEQEARLPEFFSTHPNPENRETTVRSLAGNWRVKYPGRTFRVGHSDFLKQIDGLVYGNDPRKGFREGDWYYLPQYKIRIPIQQGWKLEREGNNLQMSHPQGKAVTLFSIVPGEKADQVASKFVQSAGAKVRQNQLFSQSGMTVRQLESVITDGKDKAIVSSYFYQKDRDVFVFHGITSADNYNAMSALVNAPAQGFSLITEPAKLNPKPQRIIVKTVSKPASMEQTLNSMKVNKDLWAKIAWLNGRRLTDTLIAGDQIKVVE